MNNTRTVKTMGTNGLESFTTVVLNSLHFESHLMSTNCGPLGLKGDVEPSTNRKALSDRSWAHMVPPAGDDCVGGEVDFDLQTCSPALFANVAQFRVHTCLCAYVLAFLKHIPSCRPNLTYANMLTNKTGNCLETCTIAVIRGRGGYAGNSSAAIFYNGGVYQIVINGQAQHRTGCHRYLFDFGFAKHHMFARARVHGLRNRRACDDHATAGYSP